MSSDFACCEFCNANLTPVSPPVAPTVCPIAPEGPFYLSAKQAGLLTRPEASVTLFTPEKSWRLHWINSDLWPAWKPRVEERLAACGRSQESGVRSQEFQASRERQRPEEAAKSSDELKVMSNESSEQMPNAECGVLNQETDPGDGSTSIPQSVIRNPHSPSASHHSLLTLPPCRLVEDLTGVWVVAETTGCRPEPWSGPVSEDPLDRLRHLAGIAGRGAGFWDENPVERLGEMVDFLERVAEAMESLHGAGLVWLPFHPNWMEEMGPASGGRNATSGPHGGMRATNLDLAVYPMASLGNRPQLVPAWAPPEVVRKHVSDISPRTDVYHLALFTYYWLSRLLPNGFPGKGLASFDFDIPPLRILAPTLPVGIASVVMSGLAVEPGRRPASPRAFCTELRARINGVRKREDRKSNPSSYLAQSREGAKAIGDLAALRETLVRHSSILDPQSSMGHSTSGTRPWEIGSHTRTGLAKAAKGGVNQDFVLVRPFTEPDRALVVVADGLSCCDVGSGEVASRLVCEAIDSSFGPESYAENFSKGIHEACRRGAEAMLTWALDRGERLRLKAAQDLMSTTVLAAWLEGDMLILANAGDSRAYLINENGIEHLTVDADLGCTLLAAGSPPENVIELGPVTRALRSCVGGVLYKSATDELIVDDARLRLVISQWKLLPGETVILCSDGLVEEGAFLEPEELLELIRHNADLSPDALAFALAEAADARQSLPSQEEPDGCGDNISCCVIRICPKPLGESCEAV
jgi:protein phosphatase